MDAKLHIFSKLHTIYSYFVSKQLPCQANVKRVDIADTIVLNGANGLFGLL